MIEEVARHAGHLGIVRELLHGSAGVTAPAERRVPP
ncbi:hypothetical protein [Dactylosporangium sp. NPDC048998]